MDKMYKVTQKFMNELIKWRDDKNLYAKTRLADTFVNDFDIARLPSIVDEWWASSNDPIERNNHLIAIVQWLNGEDVFEVKKEHKFVVRNDKPDKCDGFWYVEIFYGMTTINNYISGATKFNTREEAQEWANSHQVVVEIDEEGNEELLQ